MINSPASILFDSNGNPIGVTFDGSTYRLNVDAAFSAAQYHLDFTDSHQIMVNHNLGRYPLNIEVLAREDGIGGFGLGGFGEGGFGGSGEAGEENCLGDTDFQAHHINQNSFVVLLQSNKTGVVIYWI